MKAFAISKTLSGRPVIFSKVLGSFFSSLTGSFFGSSFFGASLEKSYLTLLFKLYPSSIAPLKLLIFPVT